MTVTVINNLFRKLPILDGYRSVLLPSSSALGRVRKLLEAAADKLVPFVTDGEAFTAVPDGLPARLFEALGYADLDLNVLAGRPLIINISIDGVPVEKNGPGMTILSFNECDSFISEFVSRWPQSSRNAFILAMYLGDEKAAPMKVLFGPILDAFAECAARGYVECRTSAGLLVKVPFKLTITPDLKCFCLGNKLMEATAEADTEIQDARFHCFRSEGRRSKVAGARAIFPKP